MTAGEFAFLALGLVLGLGTGAALIEVLRARPPASHGVRVTVAPNAIQSRMAATLSDPRGLGDSGAPANGGPGDRRWREDVGPLAEGAPGRRADDREPGDPPARPPASGTPVRAAGAPVGSGSDARAAALGAMAGDERRPAADESTTDASLPDGPAPIAAEGDGGSRPSPLWLSPRSGPSTLVAVPMSMEPDPITAALRSTAAATAVAAMARADAALARSEPGADAAAARAEPGAGSVAGAGTAREARRPSIVAAGGDGGQAAAEPEGNRTPAPAEGAPGTVDREAADEPTTGPDGGAAATDRPDATEPCAEERRVADERCAVATRAREGAASAADALRRAQRSYDDLVSRAEAAAALADPRSIRAAKEQAQHRFRDARTGAQTQDDVEAGARAWLAEINRINHDTREASLGIERDRAAAAAMSATLERLAVEADAARISAERADEACVAAREAVAACDEARALEAAAARNAAPAAAPDEAADDEVAATARDPHDGGPGPSRIAAATPEPEDEFAFSTPMHSQAGGDALIVRILRGDRDAMQRAVARLAGDDPDARRHWQIQLGTLVEALVARSIEASSFDFPVDHFFWGPFSQAQNRDIAAGLSSLGFRFDGFGGWADERHPSQRDLSLAVGYAGLDPMRIRRWPTEAEMRDLLRDVRVAADEYVAGAAGGLTLGELLTLLGRRADPLAELWNQWGSVRPILLEAG